MPGDYVFFTGRNSMKEAFWQKKTDMAVTSALQRPETHPLQDSCVLLMFGLEVLDASQMWARLHE